MNGSGGGAAAETETETETETDTDTDTDTDTGTGTGTGTGSGAGWVVLSPSMHIAETFLSLQGEGMLAGVRSFFIRTTGCNHRCRWCDTPYTSWQPEGSRRSTTELVSEAVASGAEYVVVTGGEPLIQREIGDLTRRLRDTGLHVTLETAGTVAPSFSCDLLSVSPKTSNSDPDGPWAGRHQRVRSDPATLGALLRRFPEHQLKFVVEGPGDMPEIVELLAGVGHRDRSRVLLMPEGRTCEEVARRAPRVAALCVEHGFRYTPRLHLDLFGGGRGV